MQKVLFANFAFRDLEMRHLDSPSRDFDTPKWSGINGPDLILIQATIESQFRISRFRHSCALNVLVTLHVAIPETPKWSGINGPDLSLIQRLRLNRNFAYREIDILVALFTCLSMLRSRNSDMELDQRSRSDLDSTAAIGSRIRISQNRDSCCIVSLTSPTRDPRNSDMV
jgi:hypothetical protein